MKTFLSFIIILFISSVANATELNSVLNKAYDKGSEMAEGYLGNLLAGPGDTEVSIGKQRNKKKGYTKPTGSIMIVRPYSVTEDSVFFYQLQLNSHPVQGKVRQSLNYGIGKRFLSDDKSHFWGLNTFYDLDTERNSRLGFGSEFKASSFNVNGNYYIDAGIGADQNVGATTERVLNGYDINVSGQVPYAPWANINYNNYTWAADKSTQDSKGEVISGNFNLSNNYTLEMGMNNNNLNGNASFAKLTYVHGTKKRSNMNDGFSSTAFQDSDVSTEMLTKVKRSNIITLEIEGTGVVIANGN